MNKYERKVIDCKVGMKAFQNVYASALGFYKMIEIADSQDEIQISSMFYWSVIRYAKPFLNLRFEGGNIRYPIKKIKKVGGFDEQTHGHLISVRNALVAHDDFDQISPRLLTFGIEVASENFFIPTSIAMSNKCILFPVSRETVEGMYKHAQATFQGMYQNLVDDLVELRRMAIESPELTKEGAKYQKNYGKAELTGETSHMTPPEFMGDKWLDVPVPDYSLVREGYKYEEAKVKKDFYGPEVITMPSGKVFGISPNSIEEKSQAEE